MRSIACLLVAVLGSSLTACSGAAPSSSEELGSASSAQVGDYDDLDDSVDSLNQAGISTTISTAGSIDRSNEFFQSLGTNGRACVSCHAVADGLSITPRKLQRLFDRCENDPPRGTTSRHAIACAIFRRNDGSNSPNADVSTRRARERAYSMLLSKGLIRIGIGVPANAEFEVVSIDDPYHYATPGELSLFRRPLPATNLEFNGTVMWDGRETAFFGQPLPLQLMSQANNATLGHAQAAAPLTAAQQTSIVNFELGLFSAQSDVIGAGRVTAGGATGGPVALSTQPFFFGENAAPPPAINDPIVFTEFTSWASSPGNSFVARDRRSIERGEVLFNTSTSVVGPCTTCHSAYNAGSLPVPVFLPFVGISEPEARTPDMPLYTLRNKTTGETHATTDPGRALITGQWADLNAFKTPVLRNLSQRAPYFHNGSAATLGDVVEQYKRALGFQFTDAEKADLVNFLSAL